ncbi:MAG: LysR family transcriptional regulator [Bdellovibrionales bacterium]|nr:LysR family transcriptional regulator [Bdellovibrionales bacterium]
MNLQQLTTFCTVISEGSMTAAADKLFLTQPAVSQQIRNLEEELGVNLLERGVRKVKPTLQGQLLYDYARKILHMTQQAEVAIHTMSQEISGDLRIGTINSIGLFLISPIIGLFLKHNSQLNIKLVYGSDQSILQRMKDNDIDMAILPDMKAELGTELEEFEQRFLLKDEMWLVGSGRDTQLPKTIELREFTTKPVIYYSDMYSGFLKTFESRVIENQLQFVPSFEADNVGTLKRVIESGLGWGFLPAHCIKKQVRSGRLTHIQVEDVKYSVNINLYSRKLEDIRQKADVFYRALYHQSLN